MTRIDILMCTFQRPQVTDALVSLRDLKCPDDVEIRIIVADNDTVPSAREGVEKLAAQPGYPIIYLHAPERNISIARNACLDASDADWVAFVDDDETFPEAWLSKMWNRVRETGVDAVFGPVRAIYPQSAADWIKALDLHSNHAVRLADGTVETGYTCNALLRLQATKWREERFDLTRGQSGGEDTDFFFRLGRMGAKYEIADDAEVFEKAAENRLSYRWLAQRRFRMGQSHVTSQTGFLGRFTLVAKALAKAGFSFGMALVTLLDPVKWRFWSLRGMLHLGVVAGSLKVPDLKSYGKP